MQPIAASENDHHQNKLPEFNSGSFSRLLSCLIELSANKNQKNRRYWHDCGGKVKHFRNLLGTSQETLDQLASINSATIKKYEYGIRNPKPDQLLKIANALSISINVFMDFEAEKEEDRSFIPSTIKISFKNSLLNHKLGVYMKARLLKKALEVYLLKYIPQMNNV